MARAIALWREKLAFLQAEAASGEEKFALCKRIEEARAKLREPRVDSDSRPPAAPHLPRPTLETRLPTRRRVPHVRSEEPAAALSRATPAAEARSARKREAHLDEGSRHMLKTLRSLRAGTV